MPAVNDKVKVLSNRLGMMASVIKLGHEAFDKKSFDETAIHIVNNSRSVIPFFRSSLIRMYRHGQTILAQTAQVQVNHHSEYSEWLKTLVWAFRDNQDKTIKLTSELIEEKKDHGALEAWKSLMENDKDIFLVPLPCPQIGKDTGEMFIWILEFDKKIDAAAVESVATLLGKHYGEALWCQQNVRAGLKSKIYSSGITPRKIILGLMVLVIAALFLIRIPQNAVADFTICPENQKQTFAWYDGIIKKCYFDEGAQVKKGDVIIEYNTEQLKYRLAIAMTEYKEASAEYEKVSDEAFSDKEQLSKLKLLELRRRKAATVIQEIKWLLSKSILRADCDGILSLATGNSEKMTGKSVHRGEALFEIFSGKELQAQIDLNEKDASILNNGLSKLESVLYLHSMPEYAIPVKIISMTSQPVLTEQKTFCYLLDAVIKDRKFNPRYGMRGVARISGPRVSLAYYLFRSAVLWWRRI